MTEDRGWFDKIRDVCLHIRAKKTCRSETEDRLSYFCNDKSAATVPVSTLRTAVFTSVAVVEVY